jgi:hypothetical protein
MNEHSKAIVTIDHDGFMPVPPAEGSIIAGTFLKYQRDRLDSDGRVAAG